MSTQKKILSITPICCLIIYLLTGFLVGDSAWGWALTIFLLIPLMPYIVGKKKITITVTLCITLIYVGGCLISQFCFNTLIWHPAWIIFLTIPVIKIITLPNEEEENNIRDNIRDNIRNDKRNKNANYTDEVYEAK